MYCLGLCQLNFSCNDWVLTAMSNYKLPVPGPEVPVCDCRHLHLLLAAWTGALMPAVYHVRRPRLAKHLSMLI